MPIQKKEKHSLTTTTTTTTINNSNSNDNERNLMVSRTPSNFRKSSLKKHVKTELDDVYDINAADDGVKIRRKKKLKKNGDGREGGRIFARVVILDDDNDDSSAEEDDIDIDDDSQEEEIVGTQVDNYDTNAVAMLPETPATAKRSFSEKFRLHAMCADADVEAVSEWIRELGQARSFETAAADAATLMTTTTTAVKATSFFASGTPATTKTTITPATKRFWPPPPVKEMFDQKTGRKLSPEREEEEEEEENAVNARDDNGNTPLAIAAALTDEKASSKITEMLLEANADVFGTCEDGFSACHWACKIGNAQTLKVILSHSSRSAVDFRAEDESCSTAAMIAAKNSHHECLLVLKEFGCNANLRDFFGKNILIDCASELATLRERTKWYSKTRNFLLETFPELKVTILHHADCGEHVSVRPHQESPDRIVSILNALNLAAEEKSSLKGGGGLFKDEFCIDDGFPEAAPEDILRAHTEDYVATLHELGQAVGDTPIAFTPFVQTKKGLPLRKIKPTANSDTFWSSGTLRAASRAAGAAVEAVKRVANGESRHVFCCVRPPGHHAGLEGATENAASSGFSIVNNAMIGALHALETIDSIAKVCVIDFDVHHGNGTEEIARSWTNQQKRERLRKVGVAKKKQVFFCSIHLADDGRQSGIEFYPNTGRKDDPVGDCYNISIAPMWVTGNEDKRIKTRKRHFDEQKNENGNNNNNHNNNAEQNEINLTQDTTATTATENIINNNNNIHNASESGRKAWMKAVKERLVPAIRAFAPNILIISAGFDAAATDLGNIGVDRRGERKPGINLLPSDYEEMTARLVEACESCPESKGVVSILEGGYGSFDIDTAKLDRDIFANCVVSHIRGLCQFGRFEKYDQTDHL